LALLLSYAGVRLPLSTPELEAWAASVHDFREFKDWSGWNYAGFDLQHLPTPAWPEQPPFRVGVLTWPTGAVRPAWFHQVVDEATLNLLREAVGDPLTPKPLTMFDGRTGKTVAAQMYMLPPRPLSQFGVPGPNGEQDGYLITLTDVRFFWQWRRLNQATTPASWAALVSACGTALGVTVTPDSISGDYLTPSPKWVGYDRPAAAVLDAALETVGHRLVADLDGTFRTVTATTASSDYAAYVGLADPQMAGGDVAPGDIARYVPSSVNVLFASGYVNNPPQQPYVVNQTLVSLAIPDYGASTGISGPTASVYADTAFDGTNAAACAAYAARGAEDWYAWRVPTADVTWPGVEPYDPTGWEDRVEWFFQVREGSPFAATTVRRGEWDEFAAGSWYGEVQDWPQLGRVLSSAGTPPVHTVRRQTRTDPGNLPTDYSPTQDYQTVLNPLGTSWSNGTYVEFWPIWDQPNWYWGHELLSGSGVYGFHGRLLYSSGDNYGPWAIQPLCASGGAPYFVDSGDPVYPCYALPQQDAEEPNPDAGDNVWVKRSECNPSSYEFIADLKWGCGIAYRPDEMEYGLDLTGVVFDGLYWDNDLCAVGVLLGCGLKYVPVDGGDGIGVDASALVTPRNESGLVVIGGASGCSIGIDTVCASTVDDWFVTDISSLGVLISGVNVTVSLGGTRRTWTRCYNEAGVLVDFTPGAEEAIDLSGTGSIDVDLLCDCCDEPAPTVEATATASEGACCFEFDAEATGGVPPYSYEWTFGDGGTSSAEDPTHCYDGGGTFNWEVTVTDACGRTGTDSGSVGCVDVECCEGAVPATLYLTFSNGNGGCECFDGVTVPVVYDGSTGWYATPSLCAFGRVGPPLFVECNGGTWFLGSSFTKEACHISGGAMTEVSCEPLELTIAGATVGPSPECCSGTTDVTVTAVPPP
jgi:hypothetical protein